MYSQILANLTELNYTTEKLMFELMQPCSVMLENCIWLGQSVPCDTIFRVAKSSEGFCCSFNYNALKDNLEVNSDTNSVSEQLNDPVQRVSGAGQFVSLELLLKVSMAQYVAYTRSYYGISVLIHSSEDYPQASATTTVAQPDITDFVKRTRQCDLKDAGCLRDNRHIISSLQPESVTNETLGMNCPHCLPSCSEERYGVQSIIAKRFDVDNLTSLHYSYKNLSNQVTLKIHFKDVTCLKYRRDIFMTWDGFLASFGGIFGLCLGGSLISFIEIFYFFSLKLYSSYYGMVDTIDVPEVDYRKQENEIAIFHVSPFAIDDTHTMSPKSKNKSTVDVFHSKAKRQSVSYDRYLD
ncbi:pickpocket protein 11-like [Bradysia coprophila]|uniref:pickpocket protein 11-like n=1 Tax=Bradysia coprophila TaxID=38358 RepID=UPI00187D8FD8|nr:pickpocket protein 11-like [Bradysia coprophila]